MSRTPEEIGSKMDALGLWEALEPYNFAVKPKGTVFPYFCTVLKGEKRPVKIRFLMLEGWQTLHDYVRARMDRNFGIYSSPMEMPHLELVVLETGEVKLFRHDCGYLPQEAGEAQRALAVRILWEAYGVLMRLESDRRLPLCFADERAIFARVEVAAGTWEDRPLVIPDPPRHVERVTFRKEDLKTARDLPFAKEEALELDFCLLTGVMTREPRPRCVYELAAVDAKTGDVIFSSRVSVGADGGLLGLWESMPTQVLREFIRWGRVPGEIRLRSGRVFRFLQPLGRELPFKLSLHDELPALALKLRR